MQEATQSPDEQSQSWPEPSGKGYSEPGIYYAEGREEARAEREEARAKAERLHELAYTDELTGLPNKRQFDEGLTKLFEDSSPEERKRIVVIAFDLDEFKEVNDTHGHPMGNEMLKAEARILNNAIPVRKEKGEVIARIGGDEYIAAIVEVDNGEEDEIVDGKRNLDTEQPNGVEGYINRIRTANEQLAEILGMPKFGVSIGVARFQEKGYEAETPDQFLQRVDEQLYHDKAQKGTSR